jgi:hypothetical protein
MPNTTFADARFSTSFEQRYKNSSLAEYHEISRWLVVAGEANLGDVVHRNGVPDCWHCMGKRRIIENTF